MTTSKQFDHLNRLTQISSVPSASSSVSFAYSYNDANQRISTALSDGSQWVYQYDPLGQVVSGKRYWADQTPVAGQQFEYGFDDIGNRTQTKAGGDQNSTGLRSASYGANMLNQYTNRTVPGAEDVMGAALVSATVTVTGTDGLNNAAPVYRKGEYFRKELLLDNTNGVLWEPITVSASGQANVSGNVFLPQTPEAFTYDADGNLTGDGRWLYTWDGEGRLVGMEPNANLTLPEGAMRKLEFTYDHQGRRIGKTVSISTNGGWSLVLSNRFLYDGWNLVAELNATNNAVIRSYVWGSDLSGTVKGAGGVGGLLAASYRSGAQITNCFVAFDGNGNVAALVDAANGASVALYEYGPFGELLRATGPLAKASPFRFSTKYQDDETDLLYYGGRFYNTSTGRWLSRDLFDEEGGRNLYAFLGNDGITCIDVLGLRPLSAQEQSLISQLKKLSEGAKPKDPEFSKALNAVIADIQALVASVKGQDDPGNLRIGLGALMVWIDPVQSALYGNKVPGSSCNKYVARVVSGAGFDLHVPTKYGGWLPDWRTVPSAEQWANTKLLGKFKIIWKVKPVPGKTGGSVDVFLEQGVGARKPRFGDIIAYPYFHVGIYLGRGLYISATTRNPYKGIQQDDVVIHFINTNDEQLYRSPE